MALSIRSTDARTLSLLDGLVATWFVLWLVVGAWSGITMWQLSGLGDTVTSSGRAIGSAGEALQSLDAIPVVGDRPAEVGRRSAAAGAEIATRGHDVKGQLRRLSLLLGLSIGLIPTTPVAGLYLPLRLARRREVRELRRALRHHGEDPGLDRYLAQRALRELSYVETRTLVGADGPALDATVLDVPYLRPLADAELRRLGLSRS